MNAASLQRGHALDSAAVAESLYAFGFDMLDAERWGDAADVFRAMLLACPEDERAWLALGRCHEELAQASVAVELYAMGCIAGSGSVRCRIALSRALRALGREAEADEALDGAERAADRAADDDLVDLVARERRAS